MSNVIELSLPAWASVLGDASRYKVVYGGRGGGKSVAFAIALLLRGMRESVRVLCCRELQVSISDSVHKLLADIIGRHSAMSEFYEVQKQSIRGANGTEFAFKGLRHNPAEIKSYEGVDVAWVEEAQAVSDSSWETLIPTIRKNGSEIWISFNPKQSSDPTWERFVENKRDDSIIKKVNWDDNPFFPEVLDAERLHLQKIDPVAYRHIWEGEFDTRYSGAVYAQHVRKDRVTNRVQHDPAYPVYTAWDRGYGDANSIVFYQVGNGEIFVIDSYENNFQDVRHYCEVLLGRQIVVDERNKDTGAIQKWHFGEDLPAHVHRRNYVYHHSMAHFVPHDAASKFIEAGGRSMIEQAREFGVRMHLVRATDQGSSEMAARMTLPKCWINADRCKDLVRSLMHYHYKWDEERKRYSQVPFHDWSSNFCDAFELMSRVWHDKLVTVKSLEQKQALNQFFRARKEYGMDNVDPYRTKPVKKRK